MIQGNADKRKSVKALERLFSDSSNTEYPFTDEFAEAVNAGISALNKQIPQKPIMRYFDEFEGEYLCCPHCGDILTDRIPFNPKTFYFHCLNCGQKLDWSDVE